MLKAFAVRSLLPEMLIGRTVYDGDSENVLVEGGTVLDKEIIKLLKEKLLSTSMRTVSLPPSRRKKRSSVRGQRRMSCLRRNVMPSWTASTKRTTAMFTVRWRNCLKEQRRQANSIWTSYRA